MRISRLMALSAAFVAVVALTAAPASAAGPKAKTTGKPASSGQAMKSNGPATKGAGATRTTKAPKTASASKAPKTKSTKTTVVSGKGKKSTTTTAASTTTTTSTTNTGTTTTAIEWTPTNAVSQKLASKSKLMQKAQAAVGADVDLNFATLGFKNFGQFMAAVNAVTNHPDIEFADLHTLMTGYNMEGTQTTQTTYSLGQSLKQLKPGIDADAAASTATTQATRDAGQ